VSKRVTIITAFATKTEDANGDAFVDFCLTKVNHQLVWRNT